MILNILEQKENPFLKRKEISGVVHSDKNPGLEDVKAMLAEQLKTDKELIVVKEIKGKYGSNEFSVKASVYNTQKDMDETEIISKKARKAKLKSAQAHPAEQLVPEKK